MKFKSILKQDFLPALIGSSIALLLLVIITRQFSDLEIQQNHILNYLRGVFFVLILFWPVSLVTHFFVSWLIGGIIRRLEVIDYWQFTVKTIISFLLFPIYLYINFIFVGIVAAIIGFKGM